MSDGERKPITPSDVLLANQLYYKVQAGEYDAKHHVKSHAIQRYYSRLFDGFIFKGYSASQIGAWRVCDVGCGTGFLESILSKRVGSMMSIDATMPMLNVAREKFKDQNITWVMADAQALPLSAARFDLVCSNAMLHHVFGYEKVLQQMASMVKPGGKLFLGYEPNAIPYKLFWPVIKLAATIVPEHRRRHEVREKSGQAAHETLKHADIHEMAEYHIFSSKGIDPFQLEKTLRGLGIIDTRVHFTSLYQAALLRDSGVPLPLDTLPDWVYRLSGRLSLCSRSPE